MNRTKRRKKRAKAVAKPQTVAEVIDYSALIENDAAKKLPFHLDGTDGTATPGSDATEPSSDDLVINAARKAAHRGENERAVSMYREILANTPERHDARFSLALTLEQMGKLEDSLVEITACTTAQPEEPTFVTARGAINSALGKFADALSDFQYSLDLNPASVDTHFHFGVLMSRKGLWADALPFLRRSVELDPGGAAAYLHLGDALNHVDDLQGALQAYQRCAELSPTNAKAHYGLGVVYDRLNQPEEAAVMYRRSREMLLA